MQYTTNYNLKKPEGNDTVKVADLNENADIIDQQLKENADEAAGSISKSLATAANQFLVSSGVGVFVVKTIAQVKELLGLGSAAYTASTDYATAAQGETADNTAANLTSHLADYVYQVAGGTATAITLTSLVLEDGHPKTFIASADNGGAATTINTKPVYKPNTADAPNFKSGKAYTVWYSQSGDCFFIKASAEGTVVAEQVLAMDDEGNPITFSNDDDTGIPGAMPYIGAVVITPSTSDQVIDLGYHNGEGIVEAVANAIPENIRANVNIAGSVGTMVEKDDMSAFLQYIPALHYPVSYVQEHNALWIRQETYGSPCPAKKMNSAGTILATVGPTADYRYPTQVTPNYIMWEGGGIIIGTTSGSIIHTFGGIGSFPLLNERVQRWALYSGTELKVYTMGGTLIGSVSNINSGPTVQFVGNACFYYVCIQTYNPYKGNVHIIKADGTSGANYLTANSFAWFGLLKNALKA